MTDPPFKFDEVGEWSELKLAILEKYGAAYTRAFSQQGTHLKKFYIDGFSGAGTHIARRSGERIEGSPALALRVAPPFDGFFFIDINADKTAYLRELCGDRHDVTIYTGDANAYLKILLPSIRYDEYKRAMCVIDPYALHLDWEVMLLAGQSRTIDLFLNFPIMDMNRNAIWRHPELVPRSGIDRMNRFWGDESWRSVAYAKSPQHELFGEPEHIKQSNSAIVAAFQQRLKKIAGFTHVPEPLAMRNSRNAIVYYLFFASQKPVAETIITDIFNAYLL